MIKKLLISTLTPLEMIEYCLQRAKEYLQANDPMQASEKLYKTAELSIKLLAEKYGLSEFKTYQKNGVWSVGLLSTSATNLSNKLGKKEIAEAWAMAFHVHVQGFHENRLRLDDVKYAVPYIEKVVKYVREVTNGRRKTDT